LTANLDPEEFIMSETQASTAVEGSIPENSQLAQWQEEAAAVATEPDLRERVRDLTARALHERRMGLDDVRAVVSAIVAGVGSGLGARGGEVRDHLRQAVSGLDEAVGGAAQSASYALQEAADQGRALRDNELKTSLDQLRDLEGQFVDTLKQAASQSGGKLKDELAALSEHLKHNGTQTGERVRESLERLAQGLKSSGEAGRAELGDAACVARERLAQVASGALEALADSLKRQSERLRS
jgi:gas vesicle protein